MDRRPELNRAGQILFRGIQAERGFAEGRPGQHLGITGPRPFMRSAHLTCRTKISISRQRKIGAVCRSSGPRQAPASTQKRQIHGKLHHRARTDFPTCSMRRHICSMIASPRDIRLDPPTRPSSLPSFAGPTVRRRAFDKAGAPLQRRRAVRFHVSDGSCSCRSRACQDLAFRMPFGAR